MKKEKAWQGWGISCTGLKSSPVVGPACCASFGASVDQPVSGRIYSGSIEESLLLLCFLQNLSFISASRRLSFNACNMLAEISVEGHFTL